MQVFRSNIIDIFTYSHRFFLNLERFRKQKPVLFYFTILYILIFIFTGRCSCFVATSILRQLTVEVLNIFQCFDGLCSANVYHFGKRSIGNGLSSARFGTKANCARCQMLAIFLKCTQLPYALQRNRSKSYYRIINMHQRYEV